MRITKLIKHTALLLFILFAAASLCSCELSKQASASNQTKELAVHFLDVGQGDSIFIELPNNENMLIDTGENFHGEGIINYIRKEGYSKINHCIATHPHSDHIGSLPYILRHMDVGEVIMPNAATNTVLFEKMLTNVKEKNIPLINGKAGMSITSNDDISADILAPETIDEDDLNNCSLVIRLSYGKNSFLFTGDAELTEMNTIQGNISADVLKLGHHGSSDATDEALLQRVNPKICVISCGADNEYGHPANEVLKILKDINAEVYRTDKDKTIKVISDGNKLTVSTGQKSIRKAE